MAYINAQVSSLLCAVTQAQAAGKGCGENSRHSGTTFLQAGSAVTHCMSSSLTKLDQNRHHASISIACLASRRASMQPWQRREHKRRNIQALSHQKCLWHVQARDTQGSLITAEHHGGHHFWLLAAAGLRLRQPVNGMSPSSTARGLLIPAQSRNKPARSPSATQGRRTARHLRGSHAHAVGWVYSAVLPRIPQQEEQVQVHSQEQPCRYQSLPMKH